MKQGRKIFVVITASVLIVLTLVYTVIGALNGVDVSWVGGFLMTLGSVYPAYMGANAAQKVAQTKTGEKGAES